MEKLRKAIIELAAEDIGMIGEMSEWTENVVEAFNDVAATEIGRGVNIKLIDTDEIGA